MDCAEVLSAFRLPGDWVGLGAFDCLRPYLQGLPVTERADFERT